MPHRLHHHPHHTRPFTLKRQRVIFTNLPIQLSEDLPIHPHNRIVMDYNIDGVFPRRQIGLVDDDALVVHLELGGLEVGVVGEGDRGGEVVEEGGVGCGGEGGDGDGMEGGGGVWDQPLYVFGEEGAKGAVFCTD